MDLSAGIKSFVIEKFWRPITNESVFYNPFNTALYAAIFALAAAYIGKPLLEKIDIDLDKRFFIGISPFVFLGGAARSLKDVGIVNTILLETPFIYILMFGAVIAAVGLSKAIHRQTDISYHKPFFTIGMVLLSVTLGLYSLTNLDALYYIVLVYAGITGLLYFILRLFKNDLANYSFFIPVAAHYFDGATSFVAISLGAAEKHVLGQFFIGLMGPAGMLVMKTLVIIPVVYYINRDFEGYDKRYYLFLVAVLGFALGTRNMISTVAG